MSHHHGEHATAHHVERGLFGHSFEKLKHGTYLLLRLRLLLLQLFVPVMSYAVAYMPEIVQVEHVFIVLHLLAQHAAGQQPGTPYSTQCCHIHIHMAPCVHARRDGMCSQAKLRTHL